MVRPHGVILPQKAKTDTFLTKKIILFIFFILGVITFLISQEIRCEYCHKPITGKYIKIGNKYYHPEHFLCNYCHKPITSQKFIESDGKYYHNECFYNNVVPRCSICGKPLKGKYLTNFWGEKYHPYHESELKKCEYCNRLIQNAPIPDENGFYVCDICKRKEISDLFHAKDFIKKINRLLYGYGIDIDLSLVKIKIGTLTDMKNSIKNEDITPDQKGLAEYKIIKNGHNLKKEYTIFILKDIPDFVFAEIAAHELMHIWIYENCTKNQQPALVEGSCNYAAYLVLSKLTSYNPYRMISVQPKDAEYSILQLNENTDPIYGIGFKRIKKYAEKFGIEMWLSYIKHHQNLPKNF